MLQTILLHINVILLVQSLILLVELWINFKRQGLLRTLLLLCAIASIFRALAQLFTGFYGYNRWVFELPGPVFLAISLIFFSILYQYRFKSYILYFIGSMLTVLFGLQIYYSMVLGYDASINPIFIPEFMTLRLVIRLLFMAGVFIVFVNLFYKISKKYSSSNLYHIKLKQWSAFLATHLFLVFLVGVYQSLIDSMNVYTRISTSILCFSFILTLTFRPKFLNNSNFKITQSGSFNFITVKGVSSAQFTDVFFNQLYFLNPEASLENISKLMKVDIEDLYRFVYTNYNINFNDLVNKSRIDYFIELANSNKFPHYTIDALAQEAGFSSRHHLYKPFKKFHGGNPSDFLRSIQE